MSFPTDNVLFLLDTQTDFKDLTLSMTSICLSFKNCCPWGKLILNELSILKAINYIQIETIIYLPLSLLWERFNCLIFDWLPNFFSCLLAVVKSLDFLEFLGGSSGISIGSFLRGVFGYYKY